MTATLRKIVVETMIPANFNFMARDLDGSVHAYVNEPNLDYGTNKILYPAICGMTQAGAIQCQSVSRLAQMLET